MNQPDPIAGQSNLIRQDLFSGGGEMGALMRSTDWSKTPIGPVESWSPALKMMVKFLLANRFPLLLWWGPQYVSIYNDPYRPVLGKKHPWALGKPVSECWNEIWHILKPLIDTPFNGGPATWNDDIFLEINRHGFVEETHFTIAYSPVPDETVPSGIGGVLATVHEISEKVVGERRVVVLRDLGAGPAEAKTAEEACESAAEILAKHPNDIPFALIYLIDPDRRRAHLACAAGVSKDSPAGPLVIELGENVDCGQAWPLAEVVRTETMQIVEDLAGRFGDTVPPGPWSDPPQSAAVVPIRSNIAHHLAGLLVVGISSRLKFDDLYRSFIDLVSGQIATAIANARAYEEERKRAEALAEIDRAKTTFFSNVSHEFRTPLTLMLGPVEDILAKPEEKAFPENRELLSVVHRNGQRLLKLVNTLLDFSRIEAGRVQASYEPTDLASLTVELASVFRSAVEKAGLRLIVDCPPLPEPVYVDREMWEKIVLNLLSNAFKFTFEGEIAVALFWADDHVELNVRDTGAGIPEEERPHLFERFHRVKGARARTHEGSGIGLALVQELVRLHGGRIEAESRVDQGTTFIVSIPTGKAHLSADRIGAARTLASTALGATPYLEEALRWLPEMQTADVGVRNEGATLDSTPGFALGIPQSARILLADDNADMREYVRRLLSQRWTVEAVGDGAAALAAARERAPDLVLTDVMMPGLDGFQLLRALRGDPATATLPVILLSARAGEESRVEGLEAGADDYLTKPFSARELLARVAVHLELARVRKATDAKIRASEEQFRTLVESVKDYAIFRTDIEGRATTWNEGVKRVLGFEEPEFIGKDIVAIIFTPEDVQSGVPQKELEQAAAAGSAGNDRWMRRKDGARFFAMGMTSAVRDDAGRLIGFTKVMRDQTDVKRREQRLAEQARLLDLSNDAIIVRDVNDRIIYWNRGAEQVYGWRREEALGKNLYGLLHAEFSEPLERIVEKLQRDHRWIGESAQRRRDGARITVATRWALDLDAQGRPASILQSDNDITERKRAEETLRRRTAQFETLLGEAPLGVYLIDGDFRIREVNPTARAVFGDIPDLIGRDFDEVIHLLWSKEYADEIVRLFRHTLETGEPYVTPERIEERRDRGVREFYEWQINRIPLPEGRYGVVCYFRDISKHVFARQALQESEGRLRRQAEELERANRIKDEFLATLSHELRTPLNAILGWASLLRDRAWDEATTADALETIERNAKAQKKLIEDILDVSRIISGKLRLEVRPIEFIPVVQAAVDAVRPAAEAKRIALILSLDPAADRFLGDPDRLQQIVWNLLSNAVKFTDEGGRIEVRLERAGPQIRLQVRDTGQGIDPVFLPFVFDRFRQADSSSTRFHGGLGLGLSIVRHLVEQHGGTVRAESPGKGQGATFIVTLPLRGTPVVQQSDIRQASSGATGVEMIKEFPMLDNLKVLAVDDEADARDIIRSILERCSARVTTVGSVREALEAFEQSRPDVVIADIGMPGEDGYVLIRKLRALEEEKGAPVPAVALTAYAREEDRARALSAGYQRHVPKPIEPAALARVIAILAGRAA